MTSFELTVGRLDRKHFENVFVIPFQLYRPLHIRIVLTMVEVWTVRDQIVVDEDSDKCLDNFMVYRTNVLYKNFKHDNAMLLV